MVDPGFARNGFGGLLLVPGDHCDLETAFVQGRDRRAAGGFHRVGNSNQGGKFAVDRSVERGATAFGKIFFHLNESRDFNILAGHVAICADHHFLSFHHGRNAITGHRSEPGGRRDCNTLAPGTPDDCFCNRVLGLIFHGRNPCQYGSAVEALAHNHIGQSWLAFRHRAGFVERHHIDVR